MKVFSACLRVVYRHKGALLLYVGIFLSLCIAMTAFSFEQQNTFFTQTKTAVAVINRDGDTALVRGLTDYLKESAEFVELADDKSALQDALFYQAVDYILIVPEGFTTDFLSGGSMQLEKSVAPDRTAGMYTDQLVNQYLRLVSSYTAIHPLLSQDEISALVRQNLSDSDTQVTMQTFGEAVPLSEQFTVYFRMMCYILTVMVVLCTTTIMMVYGRPDLRMRNLCAPVRLRSVNFQLALCNGIVGLVCWILLVIIPFLLYGQLIVEADIRVLLLLVLNSFVYLFVALGIGFLSGQFVKNMNVQNAVANFTSLALSFFGGAFVPLELLGEGIIVVAHFVPTYWYSIAQNKISSLTRFDWDALQPIVSAMLIQLGFAAALFSVSLLISKVHRQSSSGFGRNTTELTA